MKYNDLKKSNLFWTTISILGSVILGSVIIPWIFQVVNRKNTEPLYSTPKEPTLIYSKDSLSSKIKLVYQDSLLINNNVYISSVVIWNNGELEIKKEDVRKKFIIGFSEICNILDFKILNQIPSDIQNFNIDLKDNTLELSWKHFDPKNGLEIQIIYSGNRNCIPIVQGSVYGKEIKRVYSNKISTTFGLSFLIVVTFVLITLLISFWRDRYTFWRGKINQKIHLILFIFIGISFLYVVIDFYIFYFKLFEIPFY